MRGFCETERGPRFADAERPGVRRHAGDFVGFRVVSPGGRAVSIFVRPARRTGRGLDAAQSALALRLRDQMSV